MMICAQHVDFEDCQVFGVAEDLLSNGTHSFVVGRHEHAASSPRRREVGFDGRNDRLGTFLLASSYRSVRSFKREICICGKKIQCLALCTVKELGVVLFGVAVQRLGALVDDIGRKGHLP